MCFNLNTIDGICKRDIAEKDIPVIKLLSLNGLQSPYQHHYWYKLGERQKEINLIPDEKYEIHQGYHSYNLNKLTSITFLKKCCLYEAIIPKGSVYYFNYFNNQYVSSNLIITKDEAIGKKEYLEKHPLYQGYTQKEFDDFFMSLIDGLENIKSSNGSHWIINNNTKPLLIYSTSKENINFSISNYMIDELMHKFDISIIQMKYLMRSIMLKIIGVDFITPIFLYYT